MAASEKTRFQSGNVSTFVASSLRVREADKYTEIEKYLRLRGRNFVFEYHLPGTRRIYDIAILDYKIFIELDEKHHRNDFWNDAEKDVIAGQQGWLVYRIDMTGYTKPYPVEPILNIVRGL